MGENRVSGSLPVYATSCAISRNGRSLFPAVSRLLTNVGPLCVPGKLLPW